MKVLMIHNEYGAPSGEEIVVDRLTEMLKEHGHQVIRVTARSSEIPHMIFGKVRAFFSGIYSFSSKQAIRRCAQQHKPDVAHVHNLFPLLSPSVISECRRAAVPVVMTVHNYRLVCPNGLLMTNGQLCQRCSGGREYWCVFYNCQGSLFKSLGYALRNYVARKRRFYLDNVTMYIALTQFQRQMLVREGFPKHRVSVIPNPAPKTQNSNLSRARAQRSGVRDQGSEDRTPNSELRIPNSEPYCGDGYIGYIGRISSEKGIDVLLTAARKNTSIPFKLAGAIPISDLRFAIFNPRLDRGHSAIANRQFILPSNLEFLGYVSGEKKDLFYRSCRIVVVCSICYESFGNVIAEAMLHGKPVIASRIGGIPELVVDGVTGLLFKPGNADDLAEKIRYLWERPELCQKMGEAGQKKAELEYSNQKCYERLMAAYHKAIRIARELKTQN